MPRKNTALNEDSGVRPFPRLLPRAPRPKLLPGVVEQVRVALRPSNRLATLAGFLLGGFVPLATFWTAHHELAGFGWLMVAGGLLYSARTVYSWAKLAFVEPVKALGFVVLLEGVMCTSRTEWLSFAALGYLIAINGISTGCQLARKS